MVISCWSLTSKCYACWKQIWMPVLVMMHWQSSRLWRSSPDSVLRTSLNFLSITLIPLFLFLHYFISIAFIPCVLFTSYVYRHCPHLICLISPHVCTNCSHPSFLFLDHVLGISRRPVDEDAEDDDSTPHRV